MKQREKKGLIFRNFRNGFSGFLGMLLGTLEASLLASMLTGKGVLRAGYANKEEKGTVRAGYGNKKRKTTLKSWL